MDLVLRATELAAAYRKAHGRGWEAAGALVATSAIDVAILLEDYVRVRERLAAAEAEIRELELK